LKFELKEHTFEQVMKRSGTFLIWLACVMAFCAVSRADNPFNPNGSGPNANNLNQLRQTTSAQNRILLLKRLREQKHRMPPPQMVQPGNPQWNSVPPQRAAFANAQVNQSQADTPYGSIAARNVFGLNPIPPPAPPQDPDAIPPPKITLTGITTIFGPAEALYKVAAYNKDGKQVPEQSYILTQGEAQDDIEITAIDTQKDIVTFNNHNQTQVIPLVSGVATGGDSAPSAPSGPSPGFRRRIGGFGRPGGFGGAPGNFQSQPGGGYNQTGNNSNPYGQQANNSGSSSYNSADNNNALSQLSPDDQAALIAANHAEAIAEHNPTAPIFPPTSYDGEAQSEAGVGGNSPAP
jgi:hypothetical protein